LRLNCSIASEYPEGFLLIVNTGSGTLFVVATPIGNLDDISVRARTVLDSVALVAAEDTRRSGKLLELLGISNRLRSCHEHNESKRIPEILALLEAGEDVALVSDAGTPLLSDPGYRLVAATASKGIQVSPVPGCSAMTAALSIAGLPTDAILFVGFLPASRGKRVGRLEEICARTETLVFFESVHRIRDTLSDMVEVLGADRAGMAARELTKLHESVYRGNLDQLGEQLAADPGAGKGEYTLVIAGAEPATADDGELDRALNILLSYLGVRQAADAAAKLLGVRKNQAYKRALQLRESSDDAF
jgi:16S rRNA (cytidine1402-2'-O)-methyltransferase